MAWFRCGESLAQVAQTPRLSRAQLLVELRERVPHPVLRGRAPVEIRPARKHERRTAIDHDALETAEEVSAVLDDRTAEGAAELAPLRVRLAQLAGPGEIVLGGPIGVLSEAEGAAVKDVGAALGHRVDDRAGRAPELGVELVGDDLELLDRFERGPGLGPGPLSDDVVVVVAAVEHVVVVPRVGAVHRNRVRAERFGADAGYDSRQQPDEPDEVAVDRRQIDELASGDVAADFLGARVDQRRVGGHVHRFRELADFERHVDRGGLSDLQHHVPAQEFLESLQLGGDLIPSRHDPADEERAVGVRDRFAEHAGVLVAHVHRDPRQHGALRVEYAAAHFRGSLLRVARSYAEEQRQHTPNDVPGHSIPPSVEKEIQHPRGYDWRKSSYAEATLDRMH